jgi:hypothetical protein
VRGGVGLSRPRAGAHAPRAATLPPVLSPGASHVARGNAGQVFKGFFCFGYYIFNFYIFTFVLFSIVDFFILLISVFQWCKVS